MIDKWRLFEVLGYARTIHTKHFGKLDYPVPEVRRFHNSDARVRVCLAPARTSKSYSAAYDLCPDLLDFDAPPKKHLIVGPDYDKASKEFNYVAEALVHNRHRFKEYFGVELPEPVTYLNTPTTGRMVIKWPWGAELHGKSAAKFAALLGDQWGKCILSETAEQEARVFFRGLRTRCERFIFPTTPSVKGMWIKDFVEEALRREDESVEVFQYPPEANPLYDMERWREALMQMGPESPEFQEQFQGAWVFYGGRVFPRFQTEPVENLSGKVHKGGISNTSEGHVCVELDPWEIPREWARVCGIDFGWRDATCHLWAACSPSGDVIVYDEYYERQRGWRAHVAAIEEMSRQNGTTKVRDRVREPKGQSKQIAEDLMIDHDFFTRPVDDADPLSRRHQIQDYMDPDIRRGIPRLRIIKDRCPNLVRELMNLHYDEEKIHTEGKAEHYKGDDHAIDPLGYILCTRPRTRLRETSQHDFWTLDVLKKYARRKRRIKQRIGHDLHYRESRAYAR